MARQQTYGRRRKSVRTRRKDSLSIGTIAQIAAFAFLLVWAVPRIGPDVESLWGRHDRIDALSALPAPTAADRLSADFGLCHRGGGTHCVVDGDTFWFRGEKIRIADIDTPETHPPRCAREAELGARATRRLRALLNEGAFSLEIGDRATDRYGRALRIVTRDGASIGDRLVAEGLARPWGGARRPWCGVA